MNIAFRVDANTRIGIGHVMRCLALSEDFMKRKHKCYFLTKTKDDILIDKIKKNNIEVINFDEDLSILEDLNYLVNFSNNQNIDWIVIDNYLITEHYLKGLKEKGFNVLSIDDLADIHFYSDVVVNQNITAEKLNYNSESYTKFLLGTDYVILRDDFLKKDKKCFRNEVKKLLITFGGTDNDNLTLKVLKILSKQDLDIEYNVICGPFNSNYEEISNFVKESNLNAKILKQPEKMIETYLDSDIAISAGGISCYEMAYFGIPNIIITIADNQKIIAEGLSKHKISFYIGDKTSFKEEELINKVKEFIGNKKTRKTMSINGQKLIDGKGKSKITSFMESLS